MDDHYGARPHEFVPSDCTCGLAQAETALITDLVSVLRRQQEIGKKLHERVWVEHDDATHWPKGSNRDGHAGEFETCPHEDCRLVREVAPGQTAPPAKERSDTAPTLRRGYVFGDGEGGPSETLTIEFAFKPPLTAEERRAWRTWVARMGGGFPSTPEATNGQ